LFVLLTEEICISGLCLHCIPCVLIQ